MAYSEPKNSPPATVSYADISPRWNAASLLSAIELKSLQGPAAPASPAEIYSRIISSLEQFQTDLQRADVLRALPSKTTGSIIDATLKDLNCRSFTSINLQTIRNLSRHAFELKSESHQDTAIQQCAFEAASRLELIAQQLSVLKALSDDSRLQADGMFRAWTSCLGAEQLKNFREKRGLDPVKCELVIVGGGPAGIAAAYHAQRYGIDTVLVEASYFASSMSDSRAFPVHLMRTNSGGSSLFRKGLVSEAVENEVGMDAVMDRLSLRSVAARALAAIAADESRQLPPSLPEASSSPHDGVPITRGETFSYFLEVLNHSLASRHLIATEQTPIDHAGWLKKEKRFHLQSDAGHELKPRYLLIASGAVGVEAEAHRELPVLNQARHEHPDHYHSISTEKDIAVLYNQPRQLIISDALIGIAQVRETFRTLAPGTDVLVVGSGESAAKGALALLELNPEIRVNLIFKGEMEPMQGQGPAFGGYKDAAVGAIEDPDFGLMTLELLKTHFGTPITPESMHDLLNAVMAGRARIFELGDYFDAGSVEILPETIGDAPVTHIHLKEAREDLADKLAQQFKAWKKLGLIPAREKLPLTSAHQALTIDGPIVVAAGYDRSLNLATNPVLADLIEAGQASTEGGRTATRNELALDPKTHLFSKNNPQLAFSGAMSQHTSLDGVFSGAGVRSFLAVQRIAEGLGKHIPDPAAFEPIIPSGRTLVTPDPKEVYVRPNNEYKPNDRFPGNTFLTALAEKEAKRSSLTPADLLVLERADAFHYKLRMALRANRVSPI